MPYKDPEKQLRYNTAWKLKNKNHVKKYNKEYRQRPETIENEKRYEQTETRYFCRVFQKMRGRAKNHQDKAGKFEFKNAEDLRNSWYKQREKMGPNCPITHQTLTMIVASQGTGNQIYTNISPDRLFSSITYTKQNVLFTSAGWNLSKSRFKYHELPIYCGEVLSRRFFKILNQRFPQEEWDMIDGYDWDNNRQFYEKL